MPKSSLIPIPDRGPLRVMFTITSMPVGGAETLLVNLIRRLDRERFTPELCCLKELGPLGIKLNNEISTHAHLLDGKYDWRVLGRLTRLFQSRRVDAVVTVGAGDKMFWGRLAAWRANVPVVLSALHSTGWPDGVGRLNRLLTPITDGFIAVADEHGRYLAEQERFPARKVFVIPNGVDVERFRFRGEARAEIRHQLGIPNDAPVCGIVAALRPEKNHLLFLRAAAMVHRELPAAQFLIAGDGPERGKLRKAADEAGIGESVHFLGNVDDVPRLLSALDLFALTSHNEANPVSILEALATEVPVVSTRVGSVAESVQDGVTGFLAAPGDAQTIARCWLELLKNRDQAQAFGQAGRQLVASRWSLEGMVAGYQGLMTRIYEQKCPQIRNAIGNSTDAANSPSESVSVKS